MNLQPLGEPSLENHEGFLDGDSHHISCFFDDSQQQHHHLNNDTFRCVEESSEVISSSTLGNHPHYIHIDSKHNQHHQLHQKPHSQKSAPPYRSTRKRNTTSSSSCNQHLENIINHVAEKSCHYTSLQQSSLVRSDPPKHWQQHEHLESAFDYSEHSVFPSKPSINYVEEPSYEDQLTTVHNYGQHDNYEYFECVKDKDYEDEEEIDQQYMLEGEEGDGAGQTTYLHMSPLLDFGRKGPTTKICDFCGLFLRHPSKISAHMRTHTGEKPFLCDICGQDFSQRTPYRMHMKRHLGDLPFACTLCPKKFPNKASRNGHELRVHRGLQRQGSPQPHLKPNCNPTHSNSQKNFSTNLQLTSLGKPTLNQQPHRSAIVNWQPPLGEIKPPSETSLRKITSVVEAVAAAGCNSTSTTARVPRVFPRKSTTARSTPSLARDHRQRPPTVAQCTDCGLIFKHPSKIQAHMRTHTGEKPFLCEDCGLGCSTNSALRVHIRRFHTGERPHECTWECGMRFVSVAARNEHERIVHAGIKRYQCTKGDCRRLFTRRSYLMKHLSKEHIGQLEEKQHAVQNIDYAKLHPTTSDSLYDSNKLRCSNKSLAIPPHRENIDRRVEQDTAKQELHIPDILAQPNQFREGDFESLYEDEIREIQNEQEDYPHHLNEEETFEFEEERESEPVFTYHRQAFGGQEEPAD